MTLDTARDLSLQVAAIPLTFFGMLMDSPDSEFQRISPQKRQSRKERLSFDDKSPMQCAGINRHEAGNERVLRERSSEPLGPKFCVAHREVFGEA
jgi:hypothetical protein